MGGGRFDSATYESYATTHVRGRTVRETFQSRSVPAALDPSKITVRESRDSDDNPESTPIIVGLDVTGSMGHLAHELAGDLNTLVENIYDRQPVTDPHICCMAVGDIECDSGPLQVTQFEADIRIAEQLTQLWIEGGGGGNSYESYILPWYFAIHKVQSDAWDKRKKKGYIFTVGDENPTEFLRGRDLNALFGNGQHEDITKEILWEQVNERWNVYHLVVKHSYLMKPWNDLMGQHAMFLNDPSKMTQVIVSTMQFNEGMSLDEIADSWNDEATAETVRSSLSFRG